jgi:transcriptional regulator with XRE-family HTH domain
LDIFSKVFLNSKKLAVNQLDIEVGKRINEVIESQDNVSSRQFALSIGMDPSQFAKIIKGSAAISLEKLVEISSKYNVSIEWLITGGEDEKLHLNEGHPGYQKNTGTLEMPADLLTLVKKQIKDLQTSLQTLDENLILPADPGITDPRAEGVSPVREGNKAKPE